MTFIIDNFSLLRSSEGYKKNLLQQEVDEARDVSGARSVKSLLVQYLFHCYSEFTSY